MSEKCQSLLGNGSMKQQLNLVGGMSWAKKYKISVGFGEGEERR